MNVQRSGVLVRTMTTTRGEAPSARRAQRTGGPHAWASSDRPGAPYEPYQHRRQDAATGALVALGSLVAAGGLSALFCVAELALKGAM